MTITEAIVAGAVLGMTEFLPLSGSGHLAVLNNLFDIASGASGVVLKAFVYFGAAAAVILLYWQEFREMLYEILSIAGNSKVEATEHRRYPNARLLIMLMSSVIPLFFLIPLRKYTYQLSENNIFVGISLILNGSLLFVLGKFMPESKTEKNISILDALIVGVCQCVSVIPGISRSCTAITAGVAVGLDRKFAVRYSLLLSVPTIIGAQIYDLINTPFYFEISFLPACLVGTAAAFVCSLVGILILRKLAASGRFSLSSNYCMVIGVLFIILTVLF